MDILTSNDKVVVRHHSERHEFEATDTGTYRYDLDASTTERFPDSDVLDAVEAKTDADVEDIFPIEFTIYAHDDMNTREMCLSAGLPTGDDALTDLLWNYPGEIEITYRLDRTDDRDSSTNPYELEVVSMNYEGTRFVPEDK